MAGLFKGLFNKLADRAEIDWDELEGDLIAADLGVKLTMEILETLRDLGRRVSAKDVVEATRFHISKAFPDDDHSLDLREDGKPFVILVIGVIVSLFKSGRSGWGWVLIAALGAFLLFVIVNAMRGGGGSGGAFGGGGGGGGGATGSW